MLIHISGIFQKKKTPKKSKKSKEVKEDKKGASPDPNEEIDEDEETQYEVLFDYFIIH